MKATIKKNVFVLSAFAIICTACVAFVNFFTQSIILTQEQQALLKTVNQIIPKDSYDNNIFTTCFKVRDDQLLGKKQYQEVFIAKKGKQPIALILETSTFRGYAGEIKLAIGIYQNGQLAGVRVIHHNETPGLGDKIQINKSNWLLSFNNKYYHSSHPEQWDVKKNGGDFDAFTGATITPRAVILAVKDALIYFTKNKEALFNHPATCEKSNE